MVIVRKEVIKINKNGMNITRYYRIKTVDIDKITLDVFTVEDCKFQNDFDKNRVIILGESSGLIRLKATAYVVMKSARSIGCIVHSLDIKVDNKKAIIEGYEFADEMKESVTCTSIILTESE